MYEQYDDEEIGALDQDEIEGTNRSNEQMLIDIALKEYDQACTVTLVPCVDAMLHNDDDDDDINSFRCIGVNQ